MFETFFNNDDHQPSIIVPASSGETWVRIGAVLDLQIGAEG
jgi:hypothetical protein